MHRIDGAGHVSNTWVAEDPATNRPPTEITPEIMNALQEEVAYVIETAGITLNKANNTQLLQALNKAYTQRIAVAAGTANALTADFAPDLPLTHGQPFWLRIASDNTTTTPTLAVDGAAAKTIVKGNNLALVASDMLAGGWAFMQLDTTLNKFVLLNPATGAATATNTNDATFADNSAKPASTSWVRGAMSAIATAAGFAYSLTANGYIKFPSWLAGFIIQWGSGSTAIGGSNFTFPMAFPTAVFNVIATNSPQNINATTVAYSITTGGFSAASYQYNSATSFASNIAYVTFGK